MLMTETITYLSLLSDEFLAQMLYNYERKMSQFLDEMEPLHYASGRYIDLKVELDRYNEVWKSVHNELISRKATTSESSKVA